MRREYGNSIVAMLTGRHDVPMACATRAETPQKRSTRSPGTSVSGQSAFDMHHISGVCEVLQVENDERRVVGSGRAMLASPTSRRISSNRRFCIIASRLA